jgi:hypothetical protein
MCNAAIILAPTGNALLHSATTLADEQSTGTWAPRQTCRPQIRGVAIGNKKSNLRNGWKLTTAVVAGGNVSSIPINPWLRCFCATR